MRQPQTINLFNPNKNLWIIPETNSLSLYSATIVVSWVKFKWSIKKMLRLCQQLNKVLSYFQYLLRLHVCINSKHQVKPLEKLRNFKYRKHPEFCVVTITDNFSYFREENFRTIIGSELPFTALNSLYRAAHFSIRDICPLNVFPVLRSLLS